jgi:hypothetical protein
MSRSKIVPKGKTGLYMVIPRKQHLDGRSRFAKAVKVLRDELIKDLGGEPSTQERILINRAIFKVIKLSSFEAASMNDQTSEKDSREYLAMANSLRLDLQALGLSRREADITPLSERLAALAVRSAKKECNDTPS